MHRIPILNVYYLLCYAWRHVQERDTKRLASLAGLSTVQDLLGKVLASGVNHLVRRGIDRGYVQRREDLAGICGKLAVSETAKRALRSRARAACDFEELSVDILPNRILRTSLRGLLSPRITLDRSVRGEVRSSYRRLDGVSRTGFYEREQQAYRVNPGGRRIAWAHAHAENAANRARIPVMEADVILESPERRIILDTKFYRDALARGRGSGTGKLHSDNLYQLLAYLRNRQTTRPDGARHEGVLLYPQVGGAPLRAEVWLEGFRIQARTVDLDQDWRMIREEMLEAIGIDESGSSNGRR